MVANAHRWLAGLVCVGLAAAAPAMGAAPATMDNPSYATWAKHKPGTSIAMTADIAANGMKLQMVSTTTLVSVTADAVTLSIASTVSVMGQTHPGNTVQKTVPAKIPTQKVQQVGTADVAAAGKTYPCKILEVGAASVDISTPGRGGAGANAPAGSKAKIYANDDVPGGAVKMEIPMASGTTMTLLLTAMDVK